MAVAGLSTYERLHATMFAERRENEVSLCAPVPLLSILLLLLKMYPVLYCTY